MLEQIRYTTSFVSMETADYADEWMRSQRQQREKELHQAQKRLAQAEKRNDEIGDLLMHTYEDYAKSVRTPERYQKMYAHFEQEQAALKEVMFYSEIGIRRLSSSEDRTTS